MRNLHRRQDQPFVKHLRRIRGQPPRGNAAQVGHVNERRTEEPEPMFQENRTVDHDVVGMDAAAIGVVHGEEIAVQHLIRREILEQLGQRRPQTCQVAQRRRRRLRQKLAPAIEQRRRRVASLFDARRKGAEHHRYAHLLRNR